MTVISVVKAPQQNSVTQFTVTPGTLAAGDLMTLIVNINNTTSNVATVSGTWTLRDTATVLTGTNYLYTRTAAASEPAVTVTLTVQSRAIGAIIVDRGITFNTFQHYPVSGTAAPATSSHAATAGQQARIIAWTRSSSWTSAQDGVGWTPPAGWTEQIDAVAGGGGGDGMAVADLTVSGSTVAAVTYTPVVTSNTAGVWLVLYDPATHNGSFTGAQALSTGNSGSMGVTAKKNAKDPAPAITGGNSASMGITGRKKATASATLSGGGQAPNNGFNISGSHIHQVNAVLSGGMSGSPGITGAKTDDANTALLFDTLMEATFVHKDAFGVLSVAGTTIVNDATLWGLYREPPTGQSLTNNYPIWTQREAQVGLGVRDFNIAHFFPSFDTTFTGHGEYAAAAADSKILLLTWQPSRSIGLDFANILNGTFDTYIDQQINTMKSYPTTVYVRFAHEFNLNTSKFYPGNTAGGGSVVADPAQYIAVWRYMVNRARALNATNVKWYWCPNGQDGGRQTDATVTGTGTIGQTTVQLSGNPLLNYTIHSKVEARGTGISPSASQAGATVISINGSNLMTLSKPNIGNVSGTITFAWVKYPLEDFYPGDAYVDVVGYDFYNALDGTWHTALDTLRGATAAGNPPQDPCYTRVTALAATAPVWIGETGCVDANDPKDINPTLYPGHSKSQWYLDLFAVDKVANGIPRLQAINYFDSPSGSRNWAFDSSTVAFNTWTGNWPVVGSNGGDFHISAVAHIPVVRSGPFLEHAGGDFASFVGKKGGKGVSPALTGGYATPNAPFSPKGGRKQAAPAMTTGYTLNSFSGFQTGTHTTTFSFTGGGSFQAAGRKGGKGAAPALTGGGAFTFTPRKVALAAVLLRGGTADAATWTFDHGAGPTVSRFGTFTMPGGGGFTVLSLTTSNLFLLIWNVSVDDHQRPRYHPLWKRFRYPHTRYGLLLWTDGRVLETPTLERVEELDADFVISGTWYGYDTDWQYQVLKDAGYTLVPIENTGDLVGV